MIPFFVADRPMSLRLLKGLPLQDFPDTQVGIMAHANTTKNFQIAFRDYPFDDLDECQIADCPCQESGNIRECPTRQYIFERTVKMCDSGIFTREGATLSYENLFKLYDDMNVDYGIMIDVFLDPQATLESAKEALQAYQPYADSFRLVGVAQGNSLDEYLNCYAQLKEMGFDHVAVGGLLRRRTNTVRYPYVHKESFMVEVLSKLREEYPNDWLFALGCLHPRRLKILKELDVWADYKGWIFQYEKLDETLNEKFELLTSNHFEHLDSDEHSGEVHVIQQLVEQRDKTIKRYDELSQQLIEGRRQLRFSLASLHEELVEQKSPLSDDFAKLVSHSLLDRRERRIVKEALAELGKEDSETEETVFGFIENNLDLKRQVKKQEASIKTINDEIQVEVERLLKSSKPRTKLRQLTSEITTLLSRTEREHRFAQVRETMAERILIPLSGHEIETT